MIPKRGILIPILTVALFAVGAAAAQLSQDIVYVTVTVTGPKKAPAPGLKATNFQIWEDNVEQRITAFSPSDGVWDINVVLANGAVMPGRADRTSNAIRDAVDLFIKTSNPMDKIKVEELKFGSDGLYAAIDRNLEDLQKTANPRRALVVITDGFDMPGGDASNGLIEFSRKLNIPIYFLYTRTHPTDLGDTSVVGARGMNYNIPEGEALTNVAQNTGGSIEFVDALNQLETHCKLLAEELRNKYVLGFKSTNDAKDDKWRKLKVKINPPAGQKLDASIKAKYFVPKPLK